MMMHPGADVKVGDYTVAIGNPFGLGHTVTQGIVSAKGREFRRGRGNYEDFIQTDASINPGNSNPGNSGGALINSKGELIGINTAIVSRSGGNNGIGFAVPARMAKAVMDQLIETGEVQRGRIGVIIQNISPDLREALKLSTSNGALVSSVVEDSPAEKAGLDEGDIIIEFNGEDILDASDIRNAVGYVRPGERADITYLRDGKRRSSRIEVEAFKEERDVLTADAADDIPAMESFSGASLTDIPDDVNPRGGNEGVYVASVQRGSRAARAGLALCLRVLPLPQLVICISAMPLRQSVLLTLDLVFCALRTLTIHAAKQSSPKPFMKTSFKRMPQLILVILRPSLSLLSDANRAASWHL